MILNMSSDMQHMQFGRQVGTNVLEETVTSIFWLEMILKIETAGFFETLTFCARLHDVTSQMSAVSLLTRNYLCSSHGVQSFLESCLSKSVGIFPEFCGNRTMLTSVYQHTNSFKNKIEYCTIIETEIKLLQIGVLSEVTRTCQQYPTSNITVW